VTSERDDGPEVIAKVVLVGTPSVGKAAIAKAMAEAFAHSSVRAGEIGSSTVYRTEFYWPDVLADGRRLRVRLFALSGRPEYQAVWELLLKGATGIVFVASLRRDDAQLTRSALQAMVHSAGLNGIDLGATPVAMQYHAPQADGLVAPRELEGWLGIKAGSVASFATGTGYVADPTVASRALVGEIARRRALAAAAA
jgi:hypothetical protein